MDKMKMNVKLVQIKNVQNFLIQTKKTNEEKRRGLSPVGGTAFAIRSVYFSSFPFASNAKH